MTYDLPILRDLLVRVDAATGPDRELDAKIQIALIPDYGARVELSPAKFVRFEDVWRRNRAQHLNHANNVADWWKCPKYSASIDAVVALIEMAMTGQRVAIGLLIFPHRCQGDIHVDDANYYGSSPVAAPSLALLLALLKALIAREEGHEPDAV